MTNSTDYLTPYTQSTLCKSNLTSAVYTKLRCVPHIVPYYSNTNNIIVSQNTIITWEIIPNSITENCSFQLQRGRVSNDDAWENIGNPTNLWYAEDNEQVRYSQARTVWYRIVGTGLTTGNTYISPAIPPFCGWSYMEFRTYVALARSEKVRMQARTGVPCVLFKRRRYGTLCTECTDTLTGATQNGYCPVCFGTKFEQGYYEPYYCVWGEIAPLTDEDKQSVEENLGTTNNKTVSMRFFSEPELCTNDIIVVINTSERFNIQKVQNIAELRGIPTILKVTLNLIPPTDVAYKLPYDATRTCKTYGNLC